jgi:hypothetical protein
MSSRLGQKVDLKNILALNIQGFFCFTNGKIYLNIKALVTVKTLFYFQACEMPATSIIKAKIIQALIQIERPINWNREKLLDTIKDLINVEKYNAVASRTINKFKVKWNLFESI